MSEFLSIIYNQGILAQADDGSASRLSILIGALAFPCAAIIAVIWYKIKDAKKSEQHIEKLYQKISEMEQDQKQKQETEDVNMELEEANPTKLPAVKVLAQAKNTRPFYIVHVDDEKTALSMVGRIVQTRFKNVILRLFTNGNDAWKELLRSDPDLFITDLCNDNVPGRTETFGRSGYELISDLAKRKIRYPILVISGSLTIDGCEAKVRQLAGSDLNVSFLIKPFTTEQIYAALSEHIKPMAILEGDPSRSVMKPDNTAFLPTMMEFQIGGYHGPSHKIICKRAGILEYCYADNNYHWGNPIVLSPECARWEQFWRDLDSLGVWRWESSYRIAACDGTNWQLGLAFREKSLHSQGDNAFPENGESDYTSESSFANFLTALEKLTGLKGIR
jgi:FixJ family two-component response regulator